MEKAKSLDSAGPHCSREHCRLETSFGQGAKWHQGRMCFSETSIVLFKRSGDCFVFFRLFLSRGSTRIVSFFRFGKHWTNQDQVLSVFPCTRSRLLGLRRIWIILFVVGQDCSSLISRRYGTWKFSSIFLPLRHTAPHLVHFEDRPAANFPLCLNLLGGLD